jgi:hypothetical protein
MKKLTTTTQSKQLRQVTRTLRQLQKLQTRQVKQGIKNLRKSVKVQNQPTNPAQKKIHKQPMGATPPQPATMPPFNETCDLYVSPNLYPASNTPDVSQVNCHLSPEFEMATQHFHGSDATFRWTHIPTPGPTPRPTRP